MVTLQVAVAREVSRVSRNVAYNALQKAFQASKMNVWVRLNWPQLQMAASGYPHALASVFNPASKYAFIRGIW